MFDPGPGSILPVGAQTLSVTFYPASTDDVTAGASVGITIDAAVPVITNVNVSRERDRELSP